MEENMMTEPTTEARFGPFGEGLAAPMLARGLAPNPENIRTPALDAGVGADGLEGERDRIGGAS